MARAVRIGFLLALALLMLPAASMRGMPVRSLLYELQPSKGRAGEMIVLDGFRFETKNTVQFGGVTLQDVPFTAVEEKACTPGKPCNGGWRHLIRIKVPSGLKGTVSVSVNGSKALPFRVVQ